MFATLMNLEQIYACDATHWRNIKFLTMKENSCTDLQIKALIKKAKARQSARESNKRRRLDKTKREAEYVKQRERKRKKAAEKKLTRSSMAS
jgi:hypothetical protein